MMISGALTVSQDDSGDRVTNRVTIAADGDGRQRTYADHSPQVIVEMRKQERPISFPDTE
jgi:hypothetical protein